MRVCTNAVVAIWVELTLVLGVGAVGTPVKAIFEARVVVIVPEPDPEPERVRGLFTVVSENSKSAYYICY